MQVSLRKTKLESSHVEESILMNYHILDYEVQSYYCVSLRALSLVQSRADHVATSNDLYSLQRDVALEVVFK